MEIGDDMEEVPNVVYRTLLYCIHCIVYLAFVREQCQRDWNQTYIETEQETEGGRLVLNKLRFDPGHLKQLTLVRRPDLQGVQKQAWVYQGARKASDTCQEPTGSTGPMVLSHWGGLV